MMMEKANHNTLKMMVVLFFVLCSFSCNEKERNKSQSINGKKIEELKSLVLKGKTKEYEILISDYELNSYTEFLPYAILMANKYDYPKAHYDVFEILISIEHCVIDYNLDCLDEETRILALHYFKEAINLGNRTASQILLDFYDKGKDYPIEELYKDVNLNEKAKSNIK